MEVERAVMARSRRGGNRLWAMELRSSTDCPMSSIISCHIHISDSHCRSVSQSLCIVSVFRNCRTVRLMQPGSTTPHWRRRPPQPQARRLSFFPRFLPSSQLGRPFLFSFPSPVLSSVPSHSPPLPSSLLSNLHSVFCSLSSVLPSHSFLISFLFPFPFPFRFPFLPLLLELLRFFCLLAHHFITPFRQSAFSCSIFGIFCPAFLLYVVFRLTKLSFPCQSSRAVFLCSSCRSAIF